MKPDYEAYRHSAAEQARISQLIDIMPRGRATALDIGARDGFISHLLTEYFDTVTALDIKQPEFRFDRVVPVKGDVTRLDFPDSSFDVVFCLEVLEHIPPELLSRACRELVRVARHEVVISVPYRQDLRIGRTTCRSCGHTNPPWGHVNSFDELRLRELFAPLRVCTEAYTGEKRERTNALSAMLLDVAGNPWGTYDQEESCIHCGETLLAPDASNALQKACAAAAVHLTAWQSRSAAVSPLWIHAVFNKLGVKQTPAVMAQFHTNAVGQPGA